MAVWRQEITFLVIQLMLTLWLNRWAGLSWRRSVPLFKVTGIIGLQLMLLQGFMQPIGPRLFTVGGFGFFAGGAMLGLKGILVMGCLALLLFQFLFWTSAQEITLLLRKARLPFRYAFTAGMAVRFLPLLRQDLQSIYQSQLSRGLRLDSFFMKIKGLPPIMIPLILKTLRRADAVALSMELKGFGRRPEVTQMAELKMGLERPLGFRGHRRLRRLSGLPALKGRSRLRLFRPLWHVGPHLWYSRVYSDRK